MSYDSERGTGETQNPDSVNPLQRLIEERRRDNNWSYGDIASRAQLSRSTVYYLASRNPLQRSPSASTLERLAEGLELPVDIVRRAAAEALGLYVYVERGEALDPSLEVLIASMAQLNDEQRRHVASLVRSFLANNRQPD